MKRKRAVFLALAVWAAGAHASERFGAWRVSLSKDGAFYSAATLSATGEMLSKACDKNGGPCAWELLTHTSCDDGAKYSALLAGDKGSDPIRLFCVGKPVPIEGVLYYRMGTPDVQTLQTYVAQSAGYLGIAFAMQDGSFLAMRFPINGSIQALSALAALAGPSSTSPSAPPSETQSGRF